MAATGGRDAVVATSLFFAKGASLGVAVEALAEALGIAGLGTLGGSP